MVNLNLNSIYLNFF